MQNLLVAVAVLVAALYSGWSLMPSRLQLRLLQRTDAAAATRLPVFRERVLAPLLRRRAAAEIAQIDTVRDDYADRIAVVPLLAVEPVGIPALQALADARDSVTR